MSWRIHSNAELIHHLKGSKLIKSESVLAAMTKVDRAHYALDREGAYDDTPQYIGYGATISAPHMHASALGDLLPFLRPGARVLDVGSGSGYLCAVFHHLVSDGQSKVVGIEHIPELVDWSVHNLRKDGLGAAVDDGHIVMVAGDGRKGYPDLGPYDAIHVGAAAPTLPSALVDQLASPGRMFIPIGTASQEIFLVDKDKHGHVTMKELFGVMYVPLTDRDKQFREE